MFLRVGAVSRLVGILGSFKVGPPPVSHNLSVKKREMSGN